MRLNILTQYEKRQLAKYILFTALLPIIITLMDIIAGTATIEKFFSTNFLYNLLFTALGIGTFIWFLVNRVFKNS